MERFALYENSLFPRSCNCDMIEKRNYNNLVTGGSDITKRKNMHTKREIRSYKED